ncbi:carcinoembryonic antigen-related cell adhesion molecule 20-like [Mytilus trossulus]|uniref:carcinoembryonic antigen-related cell adhesion molecule 20-like n=1 Tax=Mytilus trossulus TaxID=6551 RepID=UPI00300690CB
MIKMFGVLLSVVLVCIITGHVSCRNLTASPNYVHSGTQLTLTCDVGESIVNGTATFRSSSGSLGSITYDDMNNCYVNSSSTPCSSTCSCEENNNRMIWKYTQSSTPSSDQTFFCDFIGDSDLFTTSTTVKRAVLQLPTISPSTSSYTVTIGRQLSPIQCTETCWPSCNVQWIGPNIFPGHGDNLTLSNIQKIHSGQYRCRVTNLLGKQTSQIITVTVQYGPDTMALDPAYSVIERREGSSIGPINCSADCEPVCNFGWIYPDGQAEDGNVLPRHNLQKTNTGQYKCKASNKIGTDQKIVTVTVTCKYSM